MGHNTPEYSFSSSKDHRGRNKRYLSGPRNILISLATNKRLEFLLSTGFQLATRTPAGLLSNPIRVQYQVIME